MKCKLCERVAISDLYKYHSETRQKVEESYRLWVKAHGKIEWMEFLDKVKRNKQTGQWAKGIVIMLEGLRND